MEEDDEVHPIFTKDPDEWMQYVYKQVSIMLQDGKEYCGIVYTVDPVSETFVLVNFVDDKMKTDLIFKHATSSITILNDNVELNKSKLDRLFRPDGHHNWTDEELKSRLQLLKSWLLKNRLPVEVDGELLHVAGALVVQPPYNPENCISTNEIILGKIQGLIKNMPSDQHSW
ncbi:Gem (Nuclear organelle) associated protein 6 [Mactra antiquata]